MLQFKNAKVIMLCKGTEKPWVNFIIWRFSYVCYNFCNNHLGIDLKHIASKVQGGESENK